MAFVNETLILIPRLKAHQQHEKLIFAFDEAFLQKYENSLVAMVRIEIIAPCRSKNKDH